MYQELALAANLWCVQRRSRQPKKVREKLLKEQDPTYPPQIEKGRARKLAEDEPGSKETTVSSLC